MNCKTFDAMLLAMGPFSESERSIINYALDLREAVRVLAEDVLDLNECFKRPYRGDETPITEYINPKVLANPIAAAAVEAARNQTKGTQ